MELKRWKVQLEVDVEHEVMPIKLLNPTLGLRMVWLLQHDFGKLEQWKIPLIVLENFWRILKANESRQEEVQR